MLKTLEPLQPIERRRLLAAATDRLIPRPRLPGDKVPEWPSTELVEKTLADAREAARVKEDDDSTTAQRQILTVLGRWMSEQLLPRGAAISARERLGTKGNLDLRSYQVVFHPAFESQIKMTGIRKSEVRKAISGAEVVQHFPPLGDDETEQGSLMAFTRDRPAERNTLLVETKRKKDALYVANAWRIFHSDVKIANAATPLDLLSVFLDVFGLEFTFANRIRTRLIAHAAIPFQEVPTNARRGLQPGAEAALFTFPPMMPGQPWHLSATFRVSPFGVIQAQLLYIVDIRRYREAQEIRGLTMPRLPIPTQAP